MPGTKQFESQQEHTQWQISKGLRATQQEDCNPALYAWGDLPKVREVIPCQVVSQEPATPFLPDEMESDWSVTTAGDEPQWCQVEPAPTQGPGPLEDSITVIPINVFQVAVNRPRDEG